MTRKIVITNGLAQLIEETYVGQASLDTLMPLLTDFRDLFLFGMPAGIEAIHRPAGSNRINVLVKQPPAVRTIRYGRRDYRIAIPWAYWLFGIAYDEGTNPSQPALWVDEYRLFASPTRLTNLDQSVYVMPLHNIYHSGAICFGTAAADTGLHVGQHIDGLISNFWNTPFNDDIRPVMPYASYAEWQAATANSESCYTEWDWSATTTGQFPQAPFVLRELLAAQVDRTQPIVSPNTIPELPMGATWGRVEEWWSNLSSTHQLMLTALATTGETDER